MHRAMRTKEKNEKPASELHTATKLHGWELTGGTCGGHRTGSPSLLHSQ